MWLWLLILLFVGSVVAAALRPRWTREPIGEALIVVGALVIFAGAAWRIAFPSENIDFDTWSQLAFYRLQRTEYLFWQQRPLQYWVVYQIMQALEILSASPLIIRAWLMNLSLLTGFLMMVRFRRELFGGAGIEYPALAACSFILTPGGEFSIDTWNDHLPLVPFYVAGIAFLVRMGWQPWRSGFAALLVFTLESLCHTAEPWLWAIGVAGVAISVRSRRPGRLKAAAATLAGMIAVSLVLLAILGGGDDAAALLMDYRQRFIGASLFWNAYANGFSRGGIATMTPLGVQAFCIAFAVILALRIDRTRRVQDWLSLLLLLAVLAFPVVFETENPERYWTIALLWSLVGARWMRRAIALMRARSPRRTMRQWGNVIAVHFLGGCFLVFSATSAPRVYLAANSEHGYNRVMRDLRQNFTRDDVLFVSDYAIFWMWMEYGFPGQVRHVERWEDTVNLMKQVPRTEVYTNLGILERVDTRIASQSSVAFKIDPDPATIVYSLDMTHLIPLATMYLPGETWRLK